MAFYFTFGQKIHPLVQEDRTPKTVFVLGVYASAVHQVVFDEESGEIIE